MSNCHSSELFAEGFAVAVYDISTNTQTWRYRDQERTVPAWRVHQIEYKGWPRVAKWADVLKVADMERYEHTGTITYGLQSDA